VNCLARFRCRAVSEYEKQDCEQQFRTQTF
jgi:hypothetical protein